MLLNAFKKVIVIITVLLFALEMAMFIPIKFCVFSLPTDSGEEFYVVKYFRHINRWLVLGDKTGLFDESAPEIMTRFIDNIGIFDDVLSVDVYYCDDYYSSTLIIYGPATIDESWDKMDTGDAILYTIDIKGWDIFGEISTVNPIRRLFPKNYLNMYDYAWFDVLRDKAFFYLDGSSNW
jgi:hypothetical protein